MKDTKQQKLVKRELNTPNAVLYRILMIVCKIMNAGTKTKFYYKAKPGEDKDQIVMISNHASRNDYLFTAPPCLPKRLNYIVGYNEFFRFPNNVLLKVMQVVPKRNFTNDTYTIKQILKLKQKGASFCFMPEGMSSITGMAQPVMPGGAKLLKKLGLPVYYSHISGGYLTFTKHCLDQRTGRVDVVVDRMFTAKELEELSVEQIEDRMNRLLAHDDYIWNKEQQQSFVAKEAGEMAKSLDTLLYMCPKCGEMYKMTTSGNTMTCTACGNSIIIDDKYNIKPADENSVCPELVTDWTIMERKQAESDVSKEDFSYKEHVAIGELPKYKDLTGDATSILCGEGELSLDHEGLHFVGKRNGEDFSFDMKPSEVPTFGMCTDISRFYTFVKGEFIEFYPDKGDVLRWDHLTEEMHRFHGGKWQNTEYRHTPDVL